MDIKSITRQHGKSVAVVFNKMGIQAPVTPKDLMLVTLLHGEPFIDALANQVEKDEGYAGIDGSYLPSLLDGVAKSTKFNEVKTLEPVVISAKQKSSKLRNTLNDLAALVGSGLGAYSNAKQSQASAPSNVFGFPQPEPAQKSKNKMLLIAGIVIIIILAIIVITRKK